MRAELAGLVGSLRACAARNERGLAAAFFAAGFLFDVVTLGRIDAWPTLLQHALYLAALTAILAHRLSGAAPGDGLHGLKKHYYEWRNALLHFLLGSLLSAYTLFFFKSSSLLVSFGFLAVMAGLLVANELPRFQELGAPFKFALLALCYLAFFAVLTPIVLGSVGTWGFLLAAGLGAAPLAALGLWLRARREVLVPLGAVLAGFLVFYFSRLIPPVPLSIPFMGVYHGVERTAEGYRLLHERPAWRFWHHGDQRFRAQGDDRVFVYFRIFSPGRFSDQVLMKWFRKDAARGWMLQDTIPIRIVGGREEGFRGYGFKANHQPGDWKVQVETLDGREIGRIYFDIEPAPLGDRQFTADLD